MDRDRNQFNGRLPDTPEARVRARQEPYAIDMQRGQIIIGAIQQVCAHRSWKLWAAHVRTTHIHAVITASCKPETVMNALKTYSTRALNRSLLDTLGRLRWARHGSTRYLWTADAVSAAIHYVIDCQGQPLAVYQNPQSPLTPTEPAV